MSTILINPYRYAAASPPISSPLDISGCIGWWDASVTGDFTLSGSEVSQWNDKSGNAYHATQATSGNRPLRNATINGLDVVHFDGSNDYLTTNLPGDTKPCTVAAVVALENSAANKHLLGASASNGLSFRFNTAENLELLKTGVAVIGTATTTTTVAGSALVVVTYDGSGNYVHRQNRAGNGSGTNDQTFASTTSSIGAQGAGNTPLLGSVGELVKYNVALTGTDLTNLENYLQAKWATP